MDVKSWSWWQVLTWNPLKMLTWRDPSKMCEDEEARILWFMINIINQQHIIPDPTLFFSRKSLNWKKRLSSSRLSSTQLDSVILSSTQFDSSQLSSIFQVLDDPFFHIWFSRTLFLIAWKITCVCQKSSLVPLFSKVSNQV